MAEDGQQRPAPTCAEPALLVGGATCRTPQFAAGRFEYGAWRRQYDFVGGLANEFRDRRLDTLRQRNTRPRVNEACFRYHDEAFGSDIRSHRPEYRDAPATHVRQVADGLLDSLRVQMPSGADDQILHSAAQVQLAFVQEPEIAAVEPRTAPESARRFRVAVIAGASRWSAKQHAPLMIVRQFVLVRLSDAQLVAWEDRTAGDEGEGHCIGRPHTHMTGFQEAVALDMQHAQATPRRREGQPERVLGQAVYRVQRVGAEPVA